MKKVLYTDFVTTESLVEELLGKKEVKKLSPEIIYTSSGIKLQAQNLQANQNHIQ